MASAMEVQTSFSVNVVGGTLELQVPVPDPRLSIAWLKAEFKSRAEQRGKDLTVHELSMDGYLVDDMDSICDVLSDQARVVALGPGIEPLPLPRNPPPPPLPAEEGRTKRKYTRGGHKKLKVVAHVLESYLPEMMNTPEKERQKFYAKVHVRWWLGARSSVCGGEVCALAACYCQRRLGRGLCGHVTG